MSLGLSPQEFWGLSWYEYDLYALKFERNQEHEKFKWESAWDRTRKLWVDFRNVNSKRTYKPEDLIKLSWDEQAEEVKEVTPLTPKQMKSMLGTKFRKNG